MVSPVIQSGTSETWAPSGATFVNGGLWDGSLIFTGLRGEALYKFHPDIQDPTKVQSFDILLHNQYGRLRNVVQGQDSSIYVLTNNTDGRGNPGVDDDKILKLIVQ
jgi:glucose/arabinose dehydrogenase